MAELPSAYHIFDSLQDAVLVIDASERLHYCNNAFGLLLEIPLKRMKPGSDLTNFIKFNPRPVNIKNPDDLNTINGPTPYREVKFKSSSGKSGAIQVSIQPFNSSATPLWIFFIRDVTLESKLHQKYMRELEKKNHAISQLEEAHQALKQYSANLETRVQERTTELATSNQMLATMVNSLGQGFVVADESGICSKTFSRVCLKLLEVDPGRKPLAKVLGIPDDQLAMFSSWYKMLFEERLPFEDLVPLGPQIFKHSKGLHIALEFHPVRNTSLKITNVVVVATDKTDEIKALHQAEAEQANAKKILKLLKDKTLFWKFVESTRSSFAQIKLILEHHAHDPKQIEKAMRYAHTIKGESRLFWAKGLADAVHELEDGLQAAATPKPDQSGRKLTELLAGCEAHLESFLTENETLVGQRKNGQKKYIETTVKRLKDFREKLKSNPALCDEFENEFIKEPIGDFFKHFDDLAFSIAEKSGKLMNPILIKGGEIKVLPDDFGRFFEDFVHLITNAVDHGIEKPEIREKIGKPHAGTITIAIFESENGLTIVSQDDGGGIDPQAILEKLQSLGCDCVNESPENLIQHIFDGGVSLSKEISINSGRGVGLNALFSTVAELGGTMRVESYIGRGTQFTINLPIGHKKSKVA